MCHASVQAFKDLWAFGTITSGATMVPCPWFPAVAQMCRENPELDMGVHATLNSEWESYRWGPISGGEAGSGLRDEAGYFHQWHQAVYDNASAEQVETEVNLQIERALKAGIDVTHVDDHMGTIMNPKYIQSYIQAASSRLLPNFLPRLNAVGIDLTGVDDEERVKYAPVMDGVLSMPLEHGDNHIEVAKK